MNILTIIFWKNFEKETVLTQKIFHATLVTNLEREVNLI